MNWPTRLPLVAILRGIRPDEVLEHGHALVEAGFDAIEVPLNSPDWESSITRLAAALGETVLIGGGTVLTPDQVDRIRGCGGRLVVTPNTRPSLISHAVAAGMQVAAGFATASEAFDALDAGAQTLKLFPAGSYGPGHVRALKAVLPAVPVLAVGGVTPANLHEFLAAGCLGAGLGSDLYRPGQDVERTSRQALAFVAAFTSAQGMAAGQAGDGTGGRKWESNPPGNG